MSTPRVPATLAAVRALEWLPALVAAAYLAVVAVEFPALVGALYWDSDAAGAFVLGELAPGGGTVEIPRFGWWSSLWWLLATRDLPWHEHLWEVTGYAFALGTAALVGWATARVAGRWAGVTAASVALVVGPRALTSLATVNFHTSTPFTAAVLGAYLVVLARTRSWLLAVAVGLLAGVNAASDPLLWIAGVLPFALGSAVLFSATKARAVAGRAGLVLGLTVVGAVVTDRVMHGLGFHLIPVGLEPTAPGDLPSNLVALGKSIALVFGANYLSPPPYPSDSIRFVLTVLAFAALAATVLGALRLTLRRAEPARWTYAVYWAAAPVLLGLAYSTTNQAAGGGPAGGLNYLLTLAPAVGAGVAVLAAGSPRGRIAVSLAVAFVGVVNLAGVAAGRAEEHVSARIYGPRIIPLLEREGLTRGYAPFWDAQSLTWKSGMRLLVAPVQPCDPQRGTALCRHYFFTIDSWYEERPQPSFLIVDPAAGLAIPPPKALGRPSRSLRVDENVTVYVYDYDIARHIRDPRAR